LIPFKFIFICYVNRSGSTFLANLFSKSDDICVCPEADILVDLFLVEPEKICTKKTILKFKKALASDAKLSHWNLYINNPEEFLRGQTNFLCFKYILKNYLYWNKKNAQTIVFKAERLIHLYHFFNLLNKTHNIKWVSLIRDCRAVYNSQKQTLFPGTSKTMSNNPIYTALYWNNFVKKSMHYSISEDFTIIQFEKLILNITNELGHFLNDINISPFNLNHSRGDLWERIPEEYKEINSNILKPPTSSIITKWQTDLRQKDIHYIQLISGHVLTKFGYKKIPIKSWKVLIYAIQIYFYALEYYLKMNLGNVNYHVTKWVNSD